MNIDQRNKIITVVLGVIIIGLSYWLYDSLVTPYQQVLEKRAETELVRNRMLNVRDALIQYEAKNNEFPPSVGGLDSLVNFIKSDSVMMSLSDSLFSNTFTSGFKPDSLIFSPLPPHN